MGATPHWGRPLADSGRRTGKSLGPRDQRRLWGLRPHLAQGGVVLRAVRDHGGAVPTRGKRFCRRGTLMDCEEKYLVEAHSEQGVKSNWQGLKIPPMGFDSEGSNAAGVQPSDWPSRNSNRDGADLLWDDSILLRKRFSWTRRRLCLPYLQPEQREDVPPTSLIPG